MRTLLIELKPERPRDPAVHVWKYTPETWRQHLEVVVHPCPALLPSFSTFMSYLEGLLKSQVLDSTQQV